MKCFFCLAFFLTVGAWTCVLADENIITTVAGNGNSEEFSGNGGPALLAGIPQPQILEVLSDGSFLVGDTTAIRIVDPGGDIHPYTGTFGVFEFSGDGGPAQDATFISMTDVVEDSRGNVYIADILSLRVRKIDTHGIINTFVGTGVASSGPFGQFNKAEGPGREINLGAPDGLAVDRFDNIYISDWIMGVIWKSTPDGYVTLFAGIPQAHQFSHLFTDDEIAPANSSYLGHPSGICVGKNGEVYVSETARPQEVGSTSLQLFCRIKKIQDGQAIWYAGTGKYVTGIINGDNGPARYAGFSYHDVSPRLSMSPAGDLYVSDSEVIRKIDATSSIVTTVAGNSFAEEEIGDGGPALEARLRSPSQTSSSPYGDYFLIADMLHNRVRRVSTFYTVTSGSQVTVAFRGGNLTFDLVSESGMVEPIFRSVSPNIPMGYDGLVQMDIATDAVFTGPIEIVMTYVDLNPEDETWDSQLRILHHNGESWEDATVEVRSEQNEIVGRVTHLSPFVVSFPTARASFTNFVRGDVNQDGEKDISDPIRILSYLFSGGVTINCLDAADTNDSGDVDISDAIYLLSHLFIGDFPISVPGPTYPGLDPTADTLTCSSFSA